MEKEIKTKKEAGEVTVKVTEEIRKYVGELLIYMDDERKDYERCLEDEPKAAKKHVWVYITGIGKWIGMTQDDAWRVYGPVFDDKGKYLGQADELNKEIQK